MKKDRHRTTGSRPLGNTTTSTVWPAADPSAWHLLEVAR